MNLKLKLYTFENLRLRKHNIISCAEKNNIEMAEKYKYLGCVFNETLDYTCTAKILADAASRALGSVINKSKQIYGMYHKTYTSLYNKCVCTISDYCSGVWGYKDYN